MAKNDYFVIAYRILTYLYECFQAGERPDIVMFNADALGINSGYWTNVMESLFEDGYIKGISMIPRLGGGAPGVKILDLKITSAGIEYLQENSTMHKAKSFLKEMKEIIPSI